MKPSRCPLIEGKIQNTILDVLPESGVRSLALLAQLSANVIISVNGPSLEDFITALRIEHAAYVEADQ